MWLIGGISMNHVLVHYDGEKVVLETRSLCTRSLLQCNFDGGPLRILSDLMKR